MGVLWTCVNYYSGSAEIQYALGTFSYSRLPVPYYAYGIRSEKLVDDQYAMVASPEKALCDKIITTSGSLLRRKKAAKNICLRRWEWTNSFLGNLIPKKCRPGITGNVKEESLSMVAATTFILFKVCYVAQSVCWRDAPFTLSQMKRKREGSWLVRFRMVCEMRSGYEFRTLHRAGKRSGYLPGEQLCQIDWKPNSYLTSNLLADVTPFVFILTK